MNSNKKIITIVLVLLGCSLTTNGIAAEPTRTHYTIEVKFDPGQHSITGHQTVHYTNRTKTNLSHLYFILLANHSKEVNPHLHPIQNDRMFWDGWEPTSMSISFVSDGDDQALTYTLEKVPPVFQTFSLEDVLLKIDLNGPLMPGQSIELNMGFSTVFAHNRFGDQGYWQSVYTWRFAWNPIERAMVDESWDTQGFRLVPAYYTLTMEVPNDFTLIAGADIKRILKSNSISTTYYFESKIPQLSIPIVVAKNIEKYVLKTPNVNIVSYYRGEYEEAARMFATYSSDIISFFEKSYGTYSYQKLIITDVSASFTSMAADGMVLMSRDFYKYKDLLVPGLFNRLVVYVLAHEIAHLWWGVGITSDFAGEAWLSEAFANYLAYAYIESKFGTENNYYNYNQPDLFAKLLNYIMGETSFRQRSEGIVLNTFYAGWNEAIVKPPADVKYDNVSFSRIYEKGYWVLRALEDYLGKKKMIEALKMTYDKYRTQQTTVKQFQQVCEQVSGESLEWFFQQWLYSSSTLDYSINKVTSVERSEGYETEIVIGKQGDGNATTKIRVETTKGGTELTGIRVDDNSDVYVVKTTDKVTKVTIDPDSFLTDVYRINNTWPRQIKTRFGLNDDPLDAYSIRYYVLPSSVEIPASGKVATGIGFGIGGGYSPTHRWLLNMGIAAEHNTTYMSALASYHYRFSAANSLEFAYDVAGYNVKKSGQSVSSWYFGHTTTLFETPRLGSSSRILLDANRLQNGLLLQDYAGWYERDDHLLYTPEYDGPNVVWRLSFLRNDQLRHAWLNQFSVDVSVPGVNKTHYYKLNYTTKKQFRLIAHWIVSVFAGIGFADEGTPTYEKFGFQDFYADFGDNFQSTRVMSKIELDFPWLRELEIPIMNLFMLDSISVNVFSGFATLGRNFNSSNQLSAAESGAQLKFALVTFGGFINFSSNLGYVYPWHFSNTAQDAKSGMYFRFGLNIPL